MVFTLQRYIFRELFKVFALATIGLTLILSLGGILQPIQEFGIGPRQVLHILLYFMPITLTFVLPMAALFASALTYGRFASDNELDACRASGVSLLTMVYPGLALAIFVATANLVLSFHVMPLFVHMAEKSLKADAKQILIRNIQRRGFYKVPGDAGYMIYADEADDDTLLGIVVVRSDRGVLEEIWTADRAKMDVILGDQTNEVRLDVAGMRRMVEGAGIWAGIGDAFIPVEFGSLLGDDIKFKRVNEMKQIRANPMLFEPVARLARETYAQLAAELLVRDINDIAASPERTFLELRSPSRVVRLSAASGALKHRKKSKIALKGEPIVVREYERASGQLLYTLRCEKKGSEAVLHVDESSDGVGVRLVLSNPQVEVTGRHMIRRSIAGLALPDSIGPALDRSDTLDTLASRNEALADEIRSTMVDITAEMNSRLIFGVGCVPMIMIGIGLGIVNRGSHLLSAFGASCVPAAVLIVTVISGKHVTENATSQGVSGIAVMWSGLICLTVLATLLYAKLSRN